MTFEEILDQAIAMLQRRGRVTDNALKLQFRLDDDQLAVLKDELLYAHPQVVDDAGRGLRWTGDSATTPTQAPPLPQQAPKPVIQAEHAPRLSEAERRQLTVLFCDLVDSTSLSGQLDPEDLREVVRAYQHASAVVIARYDGYLAQYQGDGLLVYFGLAQIHADDAQRAVHTALGIVAMLDDLNGRLEPTHGVRLAVRIGIHTGPVILGTLGDEACQELLALGETPTIAAALQGLAPPDGVVVGAVTARLLQDATRRLVQGYVVCKDLGTHVLKGVADPMPVARVLAHTTAQSRSEVVGATALSPLVGRDADLAVCVDRWARSLAGQGQVVVRRGEPAIGKSRLVEALHTHINPEEGTRLVFRSVPYPTNSAFYPITSHLERRLQLTSDEPAAAKVAKLEQWLESYHFPQPETVPLLATLLSVPLPEWRYPPLPRRLPQQRQRTQATLVAWLLEEAERRPILAV